ncbi:6,7-dimethyl-8-ribityllumazine synthase [Candidatus Lucifugimonas marina]|jgi:6,7-dimethyl-8-ribityllumazine synthase|uniref:6,7-dimethyl-8-ribityllumazine synthase n=1 Tax=Candidatus Lucifugimonas marina TaxID=3038979 RepID=A0AAJ5ZHW5_9CHLR|nr:6,7-dimethyl-8-ribityllumazine synthase [SAR202 cluster bacterium JH702]MDG0869125.1 6,7-dimethyl-8-ribityllumazine synthase [SAR202 cluster bacterium JH639]WFG35745.1 6,7-dimethyl-8-ribityllumazine synthase [SAR202 cluster bacterium JH545]WFG39690.1 6,7-dimethyl-8-ribityllumazine synthase [SAR202 cluster bacterium JH1073]
MSPRNIDQNLDGKGLGIAVVSARFNGYLTDQMTDIAVNRLGELGVADDDLVVVRIPGAFELGVVARRLADRGDIDAVICIGVVIRGDTDHYEFVARAATEGVAQAGMDSGKPVIFGVLTTDNTEDAVVRIDHSSGYADAAVEMANTLRQIHELS